MMRTEHTRAKQNRGVRKWITSNDCSNLGRLQIFIHKGDCDPQTDFSTFTPIYDAPLLRALSTYTFLYSPVNPPLPSLTHLHLRGTLDALPQLQLLRLKFLHLSIERTLDSRKDPQSTLFLFQSWSLPLLVTLRLSGEIVEEEGDLVRGLVLKFSQTMVNLVLDFCLLRPESSPIARTAPLSVVYPVLHLCQRLTVLGLPMPFLTHRTPIPSLPPLSSYTYPGNDSQPGTRSLSLLVLWTVTFNVDYKDRDKLDDNLTNSGMLGIFGRSEAGYTPWSLARVIIPYTWSELGTIWDEQHQIEVRNRHKTKKSPFYHPAEPAWVLFSHFIRKNLEIFDVEGVELHDEKDGGMAIFKPFIPDPVGEGLHPPKTRRRRSLLRFPIRF
ncbi:hypothetical protein FRB91_000677 [Serendipita sp. 411]|nr:hypothetical protein FRB91_000677 [Serendipita sp. 411]